LNFIELIQKIELELGQVDRL